jgi:hypothetical protein
MNRLLTFATIAIAITAAAPALACSDKDWKACKGKPWTVGEMETPIGERWWPNKLWGASDEAGSTNWYTRPEVVQRALAEAKTGKTYKLGRAYTATMPTFGERKFVLRIPGGPTGGPFGANVLVYNDEFVATEIGQIGTQFDGLGHIGVAVNGAADKTSIRYYNGVTQLEIEGSTGLKKNSVDKLHPIVARGILIDVAAAKGLGNLEAGYEITMDDVRDALAKQGMADFRFLPGDGVFLPHRLGRALDQGQRQVQQRRAGHRHGSGEVVERHGASRRRRQRHVGAGEHSCEGSGLRVLRALAFADAAWDRESGEHGSGCVVCRQGLSLLVSLQPDADRRCDGFSWCTCSCSLTGRVSPRRATSFLSVLPERKDAKKEAPTDSRVALRQRAQRVTFRRSVRIEPASRSQARLRSTSPR